MAVHGTVDLSTDPALKQSTRNSPNFWIYALDRKRFHHDRGPVSDVAIEP